MKIAINQMNSTVADFDGNTRYITNAMHEAHTEKADLLVFPELALCGYYPYDLIDEPFFIKETDASLEKIQQASLSYPALTVLIGTITRHHGKGKPFYNSVIAFKGGFEVARYHKQLLPTYNIFDERRHFEPGNNEACVIEVKGKKVGIIICEDGWNSDEDDYQGVNPIKLTAEQGVDLIVSANASPSSVGKLEQRHRLMRAAVIEYDTPLLYVNSVGGQDSLVFDGGSFALNRQGDWFFAAQQFTELQTYFPLDDVTTEDLDPVSLAMDTNELIYQQIILGLRDYVRRCGFQQVVVGCSGGIDSAITLALAVAALGAENVKAVTMPSRFSSEGSVHDSKRLCQNLGIELFSHPIEALVKQYEVGFSTSFTFPVSDDKSKRLTVGEILQKNQLLSGVALENLQARVRGTILMEYSNSYGALLLSTGNKSEISIGYCTLYGDTNGGLNLIGDLYKTEVYQLATYINQRAQKEIIPADIITKPPSAELAPDQKDTDSLPDYEILDPILKYLIEGKQLTEQEYQDSKAFVANLKQTGQGALIKKISSMISRNEYKRRQSPPIIRIRQRAFGNGRQMPIACYPLLFSEDAL